MPTEDLDRAVAANTVGYNLSRAVGPAVGGLVIAWVGISSPFWIYAASNLVVLAALFWWRQAPRATDTLPAERLSTAIRTGLRHAKNNSHLHSTLVRTLGFFPFRERLLGAAAAGGAPAETEGPEFYGLLLGSIGVGAIAGSADAQLAQGEARPRFLVVFGVLADRGRAGHVRPRARFGHGYRRLFHAGVAWTQVLAALYVSAQVALPDWVRGRGLAIFLTLIFGASTLGSAIWGQIAAHEGLAIAHYIAAAGA